MKARLFSTFVALLMVGCGGDTKKPAGDSLESNQSSAETAEVKTAQVPKINLDDKETLDGIIAEAIDSKNTQELDKDGDKLVYVQNQSTPYTGWRKRMDDNGQIRILSQYKDGRLDGLQIGWLEHGTEAGRRTFKNGEPISD